MRPRPATVSVIPFLFGVAMAFTPSPLPCQARPLRVLVYHDMEGISGQDDPWTFLFSHPDRYAIGRQLLVADINAVVGGLFDGGATEVEVVDAHGSGNPEPDIPPGTLDPRARQVFKDHPFEPYMDLVEPGRYDAVAVVAMHAKTGSRGFASHTYTLGMDLILNGQSITETELIGYSWGRVKVPVIFASGDDRLQNDLKTMPWLQFVVTKKATSASTVELRPVDEVHAEMRTKAKLAIQGLGQAKTMPLTTPIQAALRVVPPASLAMLKGVPGVRYSENRVDFEAPDYQAVFDGWSALIHVATGGYQSVLMETIAQRPDGAALQGEFRDRLFGRWWDYESGRWTPPPAPKPVAGKRYHGDN